MGLIDNVNVNVDGNGNIIDTLSTYVTKVLKPNIVDGENVLTQDMMSAANIKYVIKYDYTLGEDITVPANCVLEFDGGSLKNGTLVGANTYILSCTLTDIPLTNVILSGTFKQLAIVAVSGSYNDLKDKPVIPTIPDNIQYIGGGETRPENPTVGQSFFDTTLGTVGKPIWYAGLDGNEEPVWVDATGATV